MKAGLVVLLWVAGCGVKGPPHPPTLPRPAAPTTGVPVTNPEPKLDATAVDGGAP